MDPESKPQIDTPKEVGQLKRMVGVVHHRNFKAMVNVLGLFGLLFGIYSWLDGKKERKLTFYLSPTRTPIVQKGKLESLSVAFMGKPIDGDVSSAEVQIWNAGKEPIHKADILKPITLRIGSNQPIHQIGVFANRDVIGQSIGKGASEELLVDWNILEKGDAIRLQLIYSGDVTAPVTLNGVVVGQKTIAMVHYVSKEKSLRGRIAGFVQFVFIALGFILFIKFIDYISSLLTPRLKLLGKWSRVIIVALVFIPIGISGVLGIGFVGMIFDYFGTPTTPPFGF